MSRYRDFDAARAEHQAEPLSFKIGGEEFTIPGTLPAMAILDLGAAMTSGDDTATWSAFVGIWEAIVPAEDIARFTAAVRTVDIATMLDLIAWIVEEATGRPLGVPASSPEGSASDGRPTRRASLSPVGEARSA